MSPVDCRPVGLGKLAIWIWPSVLPVVCPGICAVTVPSVPIDTEVERNANGIELIRAIREAKFGEELASMGKGVRVRERMTPYGMAQDLSPRELEVAQLVAKGLPNRRIATITGLQEQSVKNLVSTIMRKLRCENRVQVALCLSTGQPSGSRTD